jgi:hypothetical protein
VCRQTKWITLEYRSIGSGAYLIPIASFAAMMGINVHPSPAATMYFKVSKLVA